MNFFNFLILWFQFRQFVSDHPADTESTETSYNDMEYSIKANIRWQERNGADMSEYFASFMPVDYRLPTDFTPSKYEVLLRPDIYATDGDGNIDPNLFKFDGTVKMFLKSTLETDKIYFHTRLIELDETTLEVKLIRTDDVLPYSSMSRNAITEIVTVQLEQTIGNDEEISLEIAYTGPIKDDMRGMYYAYYYDNDGADLK